MGIVALPICPTPAAPTALWELALLSKQGPRKLATHLQTLQGQCPCLTGCDGTTLVAHPGHIALSRDCMIIDATRVPTGILADSKGIHEEVTMETLSKLT